MNQVDDKIACGLGEGFLCTYSFKFCMLIPKYIDQIPKLACALNGSAATSRDIFTASHRFIIQMRHYGIDQLYLRKVH